MSGFLPSFWTPSDIKAAQSDLAAKASAFNTSVQSCTELDAASKSSWQTFYASLTQFTQTTFGWVTTTLPDGSTVGGGGTGTTADQIQTYQRELYAWGQKLSKTCTLSAPNPNPNVPGIDVVAALKYGAVIAGFVGSAYMVGKVIGWTPSPRDLQRERRSSQARR